MLTKSSLSSDTLARVLEQSADCVKLISLDGHLLWINANGQNAMEIDDFSLLEGSTWASMWPEDFRSTIDHAYAVAKTGEPYKFDAFCPTSKGTARWWNVCVSLVTDLKDEPAAFLTTSRDITAAKLDHDSLALAAAEMGHRLSNSLAVVGALLFGFARGNPDREVFASEMQHRLKAMAAIQSLYTFDGDLCNVDNLLTALISPFSGSMSGMNFGQLVSTPINRQQADAIALVLGELAVNSIKHGALGHDGEVNIEAFDDKGLLKIVWNEKFQHLVAGRTREGGQGLSLIKQIIAARSGTLDIVWQDRGLEVTLAFQT